MGSPLAPAFCPGRDRPSRAGETVKRFWSNSLAREITLVLFIKLAFIFGLWFVFFRHPVEDRYAAESLGRVVFGSAPSVPAPPKE